MPVSPEAADEIIRVSALSAEEIGSPGVWAIARDSTGFMWFGTLAGLCRYDGQITRMFTLRPGDLRANFVRSIVTDRGGKLWLGTSRGVFLLDTYSETIRDFLTDADSLRELGSLRVGGMFLDRSGTLWIGDAQKGLVRVNASTLALARVPCVDTDGTVPDVRSIHVDRTGVLWAGTMDHGLLRLDTSSGCLVPWKPLAGLRRCVGIAESTDGTLFVASYDALCVITPERSAVRCIRRPEILAPGPMAIDNTATLWIGALSLLRFIPHSGALRDYSPDLPLPEGTRINDVVSIFCDTTGVPEGSPGILWVGSKSGGVTKIVRLPRRFRSVLHSSTDPRSPGHGAVHALYEDRDGSLWCGSWGGGMTLLDRDRRFVRRFIHIPGDRTSIPDDDVRCFLRDTRGRFWAGTSKGVCVLDDDRTRWRQFHLDAPADSYYVSALHEDRRGTIWVGTFDAGLFAVTPSLHVIHYPTTPGDSTALSDDQVQSIAEDSSGSLWIGTAGGGLNRFDPATHAFRSWKPDSTDRTSLSNINASKVFIDTRGGIWVGTFDGLNHYASGSNTFTRYTNRGWPLPWYITGIVEDASGALWIASNAGLIRFSPSTGMMRTFGTQDGLGVRPPFSCCSMSKGEIFLGGE